MSWLSKLGHGLVKGLQVAQPILGVAAASGLPGAGLAAVIANKVLEAQSKFPQPGSGESKAEFVIGSFDDALEDIRDIAASSGKLVTYDAVLVRQASDAQVAAYKLTADAIASIKIVDKPKA